MKTKIVLAFKEGEFKSLSEAVYEKIKQVIVTGGVPPSSRISERDLADRMKVSTTTVKRALNRLSTEGLVEIRPRRGTYVCDSLSRSMEENTLIRAYLEGLASRFAAEKADEDSLRALARQIEIMRQRTEKGSHAKRVEANRKFHRLIHATGKNPYLCRMIEVVRSFDTKMRDDSLSDPDETKRGFNDHVSILEAIRARDGTLAEDRMRSHILRVLKFVLAKYK